MNKKTLSFFEMFNLNFGFLGIQFGWGLQMANMSAIYKFLGAQSDSIGFLWLAAPMTGMIIQPLLGHLSDKTWMGFLGRRRIYILIGAIVSTIALFLMPNSNSIFMAAVLLWILDASINISMQPYRSLVADVAPENQHTHCYAIQTFLVGIGATLASALPWIFQHVFEIHTITAPNEIPLTIKLSFYIGASFFLLANLWTVFASHEYPPSNLEKIFAFKKDHSFLDDFKDIVINFIKMPKIMRWISAVQFFTWMGMFCFFLFFSLGIAQNIFGLPINADAASFDSQKMLENAAILGGLGCAAYNFVSFIYAYFLPKFAKLITRKTAHIVALCLGGLSLIGVNFAHSQSSVFLAMIGLGIAWASIVTIPYAILAGHLNQEKMGLYMGLFNLMICIPEILAALTLGFVVKHIFHNYDMHVVVLGGVFMLIAAGITFFVHDKKIEESA